MCPVHKPRVPHGPTSQQKLGPADDVANDTQLLGQPKDLTTSQKGDPITDRKAWPRNRQRLLLTPARLSDRKARPRRNGARFRLRSTSPTGRPGQGGTALASDPSPPLRPEGLAKEEWHSPPTSTCLSDRKATEPLLTTLL